VEVGGKKDFLRSSFSEKVRIRDQEEYEEIGGEGAMIRTAKAGAEKVLGKNPSSTDTGETRPLLWKDGDMKREGSVL